MNQNKILHPNLKAVLWDMDGVIINSLEFDINICGQLLSKYTKENITVPEVTIRRYFAYAHKQFWEGILNDLNLKLSESTFEMLLKEYDKERESFKYTILPGVTDLLGKLESKNIISAVVSSNESELIKNILINCKLDSRFKLIIGFDTPFEKPLNKKPAPDMYLAALKLLNLKNNQVFVIEDSVAGVTAGINAGCPVVAVATGGATRSELNELISDSTGLVVESIKDLL